MAKEATNNGNGGASHRGGGQPNGMAGVLNREIEEQALAIRVAGEARRMIRDELVGLFEEIRGLREDVAEMRKAMPAATMPAAPDQPPAGVSGDALQGSTSGPDVTEGDTRVATGKGRGK